MQKLTRAERHEIYKEVLGEVDEASKEGQPVFICVEILDILQRDRFDITFSQIDKAFPELALQNPLPRRVQKLGPRPWWGGSNYHERIKVLNKCISLTARLPKEDGERIKKTLELQEIE